MDLDVLSAIPLTCPVVVGRETAVRALDDALNMAAAGNGRTLILSGEAGIGKSRLAAEARARAAARGFSVLLSHCYEADQIVPYAPLLELVQPFVQRPPGEEGAEWEKRHLFRAVTDALAQRTAPAAGTAVAALLLVVEDLHWSDQSTREYLLYLARHMPDHVMLLLTCRSDEASPELVHFLATLERERLGQEIVLTHLDRAQVAAMVVAMVRIPGGAQDRLAALLSDLTAGNPFFVEELLKAMILSGSIYRVGEAWQYRPGADFGAIPRSVQDTVRRRTAGLSPDAGRVLVLAAVIGREFEFALLQALTGLAEPSLLAALKELMAAQLLAELSAEQFAFRHALVREVVYGGLLLRERKALHAEVAAALQRLLGDVAERAGNLAAHFFAAEQWDQALVYSQSAAEYAAAIYALPEAREHYDRALQAGGQAPDAATAIALHTGRGHVCETLGDFAAAQADYEVAVALARANGDLPGEWQATVALGFLWAARDYAQAGEYLDRALVLARHLEDAAALGHTLNRVGNWYMNVGQTARALGHHEEALAIFEELRDEAGLAETWDLLGATALNQGDVARLAFYYEHAIALYRKLGNRRGLAAALAGYAQRGPVTSNPLRAATPAGVEGPLRDATESARVAQEIGWRAGEAYALSVLADLLLCQGEFARVLPLLEQARAIAGEIGHRQWQSTVDGQTAGLYGNLLDLDRADAYSASALNLAQAAHSAHMTRVAAGWRAFLCVKMGKTDEAERLLALAGDSPSLETFSQRLWWYLQAEIGLARGNPAEALGIVEKLIEATPNITPQAVVPWLWKARGEALAALKRYPEAEIQLRAACAALLAQGQRPLLWQTHIALGKVYRLQRRRDQAEAEFAAARAVIEWLASRAPGAATRENFRTRACAQIPVLPPRSEGKQAKRAFGGLTAREREVARLIAQGLSNREIASALVLSERTVETHLGNILAKLGFQARTQIAAWVVARGLAHG